LYVVVVIRRAKTTVQASGVVVATLALLLMIHTDLVNRNR
jgi:hypothetical protein